MGWKLDIIVVLICIGFAKILINYFMFLDETIKSEKIYHYLDNIFGFILIAGMLLLFADVVYNKQCSKDVINDEKTSIDESVYREMEDIELYNQMMIIDQLNNWGTE